MAFPTLNLNDKEQEFIKDFLFALIKYRFGPYVIRSEIGGSDESWDQINAAYVEIIYWKSADEDKLFKNLQAFHKAVQHLVYDRYLTSQQPLQLWNGMEGLRKLAVGSRAYDPPNVTANKFLLPLFDSLYWLSFMIRKSHSVEEYQVIVDEINNLVILALEELATAPEDTILIFDWNKIIAKAEAIVVGENG